jgi:hypothetical protein
VERSNGTTVDVGVHGASRRWCSGSCEARMDTLSRELGVTAARFAEWRDAFLAAGQSGLKSRSTDHRDEEIARLRAKIGELTMDKELLELAFERVAPAHLPPLRRPSK